MKKPPLSLGVLLMTLISSSIAHAAPAIPNPSFEVNAPFATSPGTIAANGNTAIIGWTANDPARVGLNPAGGLNFHADNGKVPNGTRVAFLNSVSNNTASLSTTITGLNAGTHYRVRFRFNRKFGTASNSPVVTCRINGVALDSQATFGSVNPAGTFTAEYLTQNLLFVAAGPTAALEISNTTSADSSLLLDDFSITAATLIQVTNLNNDGAGSLRQAVETAKASAAFNLITFAPALSGQKLELVTGMNFSDFSGVAIDATSLARGITIARTTGATNPLFIVSNGEVHLRGLTLTGGGGNGAGLNVGGGANAVLTRCTLFGNGSASTSAGGAVGNAGFLSLVQCTLADNTSAGSGGALHVASLAGTRTFVDQSTIASNDAATSGGGIFCGGQLTLTNSIVGDNNAPTTPDLLNSGTNARLTRVGANVIESFANSSGASDGGTTQPLADPLLSGRADNGGATQTMALRPGSPARNASLDSTFTTDQRGRAIQGTTHDIGAYDVQLGRFQFSSPSAAIPENAGTFSMSDAIQRVDGFEGAASVKLSAVAVTAGAADFTAFSNLIFNFADAQVAQTINLTVANDDLVEPNEFFHLVLSAPSAGTTIGSSSILPMTILDPSSAAGQDTTPPPAPAFSTPAANATVSVALPLLISGTATDGKGVRRVEIRTSSDGGPFSSFLNTRLARSDAPSTTWSFSLPVTNSVTTLVIEAQSFDTASNPSGFASRTITVQHPLRVRLSGNGTVSPGFAPVSFRRLGSIHTITSTPAPGNLFVSWGLNTNPALLGVPAEALERPTLTFMFNHNLELTANVRPNPFGSQLVGNYKGLLTPSTVEPTGGSSSNNSTEGLFNCTLTPTAAFSGNIVIDGQTHAFAGALDISGVGRFGTSRARTLRIPRPGKPVLILSMKLRSAGGGTFSALLEVNVDAVDFRDELIARSETAATRSHYNGTTQVPDPSLLGPGGANQVYNIVLPPVSVALQPSGFEERFYPQGSGFGRLTLTKFGTVTLTDCTLADGTTGITASTFLDLSDRAVLFLPLYNKGGFLRTVLEFDAGATSLDVVGDEPKWLRPRITTSHYYPEGWPEVIDVQLHGAKYTVTPGQSVFVPGNGTSLNTPDADGNVTLSFTEGQLSSSIERNVNLSSADMVTEVPAVNPTYSFTLSRTTGLFSGTFTHADSNVVTFKGILLQKPNLAGGYGFFLTKQPVPIDFSGESGRVDIFEDP